jgi:1-acyl-sn-glycerol-3-phosphate acyltransferase
LQARAQEVTTDIAGTPPDEVVLAPPSTVPKTSSGKIRRSSARELYVSGHVGPTRRSPWWQLVRLALSGVGPQIRRSARLAREVLYAVWWWVALAGAFLLGSLAIAILPRLAWRWSAVRWISRGTLVAMGVPVSTIGIERIPSQRAMLAFNHSSYMDALVLAAALPGEPAVVAKKELSGQLIAGSLLRRLGIPFVERYDVSSSLADAEALIASAREGRVLVFFPEGTFTRRAGLSGFYLGAFKVAAEANLPVLPGTIRGTRSLLRSDQWFPRSAAVTVEIGEPVMPSGTDFGSVVRLRDEVRKSVLSRCGEPDLGELVKPAAIAS